MPKLSARHLVKKYKKRTVVNDVSVSIEQGEIVGLLGPNGAGKTTCFYMIVGLVNVDAGHIFLDDHDITAMAMHQRARLGVGYLPQEASIFRKLSVFDNIMGVLQLRRHLSLSERHSKAEQLLGELHLSHLRDNKGMSLSGGERRRVEIARALAMEPRFMLLDEPFAGIDPISVVDIKQIIRQLRDKGIGILITDHNVRETLDICENAYILNEGQLLALGSPQEILAHTTVRTVYLGSDFVL